MAGVTQPAAPRSPRLRSGRLDLVFAADVLVAIVCFGITDGVLVTNNSRHHLTLNAGVMFLLAVVVCAPLVVRTLYPLTAWSASALALFWASLFVQSHHFSGGVLFPAGVLVYILCLYSVALRCQPWMVTTAGLMAFTSMAREVS